MRSYKTIIENSCWYDAIEFTKNAANLSITNEQEFVEKYIIAECEIMVNGLENIYCKTEFEFIYENQVNVENKKIIRHRIDIQGYELIDFRSEKIIGALDFISKIIEYNSIIPTTKYTQRIININKKFISSVYTELENQNNELKKTNENFNEFIIRHNELIAIQRYYNNEKFRLKIDFENHHKQNYLEFNERLKKSLEVQKHYFHNIKLYTENINKLKVYINKYNKFIKE